MKFPLLVFILAAVFAQSVSHAQIGREMALVNSPAYESAAAPLRGAPPRQYNFSKAVLSDVMRLMAEDAGIGFFGLPDGTAGGDRLVTFTLNASPFVALETLAKANGVALIYEGGIWYLRPANDQELIGRIYEINYNAQELVTKNSQGGGGCRRSRRKLWRWWFRRNRQRGTESPGISRLLRNGAVPDPGGHSEHPRHRGLRGCGVFRSHRFGRHPRAAFRGRTPG